MTEREFINRFIDDLVRKYGYPREAIKQEIRIGNNIYDIAIQKGVRFVQVFEFKRNLSCSTHVVLQRFSDLNVNTPCFYVIFNSKDNWELYDASNLRMEIRKVEEVLNFDKAVALFFNQALSNNKPILQRISTIANFSAIALIAYIVMYVMCYSWICPDIVVRIPLSFEIITCYGIIVILFLLPSLLELLKLVKRVKIGAFELELKDELGI
ncbi:MAG: hypothetical protein J6T80_07660 [Paludibacteraceae bacterium]|nr:hypothetical protein [Paludibacteraceae bacterium]